MQKEYLTDRIYSLFLIVFGTANFISIYISKGVYHYAELLPAAVGILLYSIKDKIKEGNKISLISAFIVSTAASIIFTVFLVIALKDGGVNISRQFVFTLYSSASWIAAIQFYTGYFRKIKN